MAALPNREFRNRDIVLIGGSSGSYDVLRTVFSALPATLRASLFIVVHRPASTPEYLSQILASDSQLPVTTARDGEAFETGKAYIAPPDHHLLLRADGHILLGHGPRENMARPAIDPLFRSGAAAFGPRVIAVILSGLLDDGASGLAAVKRCGGVAVVQDPLEAIEAEMPLSALRNAEVDYKAPAAQLSSTLAALTQEVAGPWSHPPADIALEVKIAAGMYVNTSTIEPIADPAPLSCPDCGGALSEIKGHLPLRYRCQIGHAYTAKFLDVEQKRRLEEALAIAMRTLEERATLNTRMARDATARGNAGQARNLEERAREYHERAETVRHAMLVAAE